MGLASLFMVACNNTPKQPEQPAEPVEEQKVEVVEPKAECPMSALKAEYANWDNLDETAKAELNKKAADLFADMQAKKAEMMAAGEGCAKEMAEMTEEAKAECQKKCEEMKAAWDNFGNLTVDEQKDFIMKQLECCGGEKKCCKGEEGKCEEKPAE